jgi:hypothetical protein
MERRLNEGLPLSSEIVDSFADFTAELNTIILALDEVWPSSRWGVHSESSIFVKRVGPVDLDNIPGRLVSLNAAFSRLLDSFKAAKTAIA